MAVQDKSVTSEYSEPTWTTACSTSHLLSLTLPHFSHGLQKLSTAVEVEAMLKWVAAKHSEAIPGKSFEELRQRPISTGLLLLLVTMRRIDEKSMATHVTRTPKLLRTCELLEIASENW